jgi:hypothetical protein
MPAEPTKYLVQIDHPHGELRIPLELWIERGPGPRDLVRPIAAYALPDEREVSLSVVPLRYRNNRWSRLLVRLGMLVQPWPEIHQP